VNDAGQLAEGTIIGEDFVVARRLGRGGMGAVYEVQQKSTGKLRALKVMHGVIGLDATMQRRFEQEAKVGARIKSAHVVEVVAAGVDGVIGVRYLVMERLEGVDLSGYLARKGPLPFPEVLGIFEQLCHAIAAAHTAGIVHRDLKPENIFIASSNQAGSTGSVLKVLDFGIAKLASETTPHATEAIGSPLWMAPEQTAPGPVTPAADVWALGLIAYQLLTGTHFWTSAHVDGATPMHVLREIVVEPIPAASARGGDRIPPGFDAWFARCVARDPTARFPTAGEAWDAMKRLPTRASVSPVARTAPFPPEALADTTAAEPYAPTPAPALAPRSTLTAWLPWAGGAAIAVVGLGAYWWAPRKPLSTEIRTSQPSSASSESAESTSEDEPPQRQGETLADGFSDPEDSARRSAGGEPAIMVTVQGHHVRLFSRIVKNDSNVIDSVVRDAIDHSSSFYLERCYAQPFKAAKDLPGGGAVTISFDILDKLPQHATLEASTFKDDGMGRCMRAMLTSHTINAAGDKGAGHVVYAFKIVVTD
jgi:serine/threonine protein kinase